MRHGEALSQAEWDRSDSSRPLTEKGRLELETAVEQMKKAGFKPTEVLSSPYVRAQQTAEIMSRLCGADKLRVEATLSAGASIEAFQSIILNAKDKSHFLIVGHVPDLTVLVSFLLSDPWMLEQAHLVPGEIWALETGDHEKAWGDGKTLWRRTLQDWKKLK